ncbi:putative vacuolar protein sorting-associated protein Ist1 [Tanacetum coccineum]
MIGIKKRFQVAKCKTSLKLATARIKLMRNKKGAQVIQMKKELAQLLASGDDRTARIRVEHVIREEKMIGAYDLIEIYCELIVARLPIIESQKTCPMDLKEAIASVIFATPRCSDITELVDVKKNFRAKYGKEFVTAATELIPGCGVSQMLVEKLSAVAPNIQTKVKVLSDIAKEHNVDWEATSFEESKPRDDLLATPITVDPPKVQTSNVDVVQSHQTTPDVPADFFQQNKRFTSDAQKNLTPADTSSQQSSYASTSHNDARPTGMASGSMKKNQSLRSNSNNSNHSSDKDNENMEFKDATSAAHAAAEAAERASYAARAAAQLAREGSFTQQHPTKSHESHIRDEMPYKGSFNDRKSKIQNQQVRQNESTSSPKVTKSSSGSRSRNDSDEGLVNYDNHQEDRYSRTHEDQGPSPRKSSKKESEARFKRGDSGSSKSRSHSYSRYDETDYDDDDDQGSSPEISSRQKSNSKPRSSRSHSNDDTKKVGRKTVVDQEPVVRKTKTSSFSGARRDDESESGDDDYDGPRFDAGFDHVELEDAGKSFFPSPDKEVDSHVWSPIKNTSNIKDRVKPAKSVDHSVKSNLSDGPDSGSETETVKSGFSGSYKFDSPRKQDFSRNSRTELDDLMQRSSSYHKQSDVLDTEEDLRFGTLAGSRRNKGNQKPHTKITSPSSKKPVEESQSPVKVNQASSFNSRPSRVEKKKPSVYKTSSESDSDDNDDKFPEKPSRSPFARPNTFFSYGNDSDEEVSPPKHTPPAPSKAPLSPHGVSRRTKGQPEPKAKQSRAEPAEDLKKRPTSTISPPKPQPHAARPKQEPPKRIPEPKVSKPEVSTPPAEVDNVKKPRHVHPKLPDFETLADRIYAINKMERQ